MNFLLHRHLAERDLASPAAGIGAMLPDLWRMADRRVRPSPGIRDAQAPPTALGDVLAGIDHHLETDRWFHGAAAFVDGERLMAAQFRQSGVAAPKLGMFAHVAWEMWLDGALVRRIGIDDLLAGLRNGFAVLQTGAGERAAALHHFDRAERPASDRAAFADGMHRIVEEIGRGPWIEGYQYGTGVARRVSGMRGRLGLRRLDDAEQARIGAAIDELIAAADDALDAVLAAPR